MANDKKYLSKIAKGSDTLWLKDAEARQEIEDIKSSITGAMHFIGVSSTAIADGDSTGPWTINSKTYIASGTPAEGQILLVAGDVAVYAPSGKTEREFVWSGDKWQEYGSTGSLKALAFKDSASATYTPAGTNAASAVTFTGQASGTFVTGFNDDAVAPSLGAATTGSFVTGFDQSPVAPSFTEGAFTPAAFQTGFATAGSAASFTEGTFSAGSLPSFTEGAFSAGSLPSLGAATTGNFATEGETSTYDENSETLTFSAASTSAAVTAQGTFDAGSLPSKAADTWDAGSLPSKDADTFVANVPTAIDVTKFDGGSKAKDTFSAGTLPTLATGSAVTAQGTFNAGSAATPTTASAITAVGTGEAAAQVFSGTEETITVS